MADSDPDHLLRFALELNTLLRTSPEGPRIHDLHSRFLHIASSCQKDQADLLALIEHLQTVEASAEKALQEAREKDQTEASPQALRSDRETLLERQQLLREEERRLENQLEALSERRRILQAQKDSLRRAETEFQRYRNVLGLCASTFRIVPSFEGNNRVAGNLVNSKGCVTETFGFNIEDVCSFDICSKLWNMVGNK